MSLATMAAAQSPVVRTNVAALRVREGVAYSNATVTAFPDGSVGIMTSTTFLQVSWRDFDYDLFDALGVSGQITDPAYVSLRQQQNGAPAHIDRTYSRTEKIAAVERESTFKIDRLTDRGFVTTLGRTKKWMPRAGTYATALQRTHAVVLTTNTTPLTAGTWWSGYVVPAGMVTNQDSGEPCRVFQEVSYKELTGQEYPTDPR